MNITLRIFDETIHTTLSDFLIENHDGMTDEEREAVKTALKAGRIYHGGGGAETEWTIEPR